MSDARYKASFCLKFYFPNDLCKKYDLTTQKVGACYPKWAKLSGVYRKNTGSANKIVPITNKTVSR